MSTHDEDHARAKSERAEIALKLERNAGRLDQIYEGLRHDPEHVALMRGLAWTRTGRTFSLKDGKPSGVPDGWADGVDQETFIGDWINDKKGFSYNHNLLIIVEKNSVITHMCNILCKFQLSLVIFAVPGVIIGGQLGPMVSSRISQHTLERALAILFIIVAALMLGEVLLRSAPV